MKFMSKTWLLDGVYGQDRTCAGQKRVSAFQRTSNQVHICNSGFWKMIQKSMVNENFDNFGLKIFQFKLNRVSESHALKIGLFSLCTKKEGEKTWLITFSEHHIAIENRLKHLSKTNNLTFLTIFANFCSFFNKIICIGRTICYLLLQS